VASEVAAFVLDGAEELGSIEGRRCIAPLGRCASDALAFRPLDRDAPWLELFTSGTTGAEKPVAKAVRHLEDEVAVLESRFGGLVGEGTRVLSTASPQHLYGLLFRVLWPLASGRPFLRTPVSHPEELDPHMQGRGETRGAFASRFLLASTPVALRRLADRPGLASHAEACQAVFSSGGPLDAEVARRIGAALGQPPIEVYGSTETGGIAVRQQWQGEEVWQPLPGVAVEISPENRLVVTSPFVSGGEPVADRRERLATGDRVAGLRGGGFRLLGRVDRVVKIAEKRLSLPDMESRLHEHPAVADAVLVPLETGAGSRLAALVVPTPDGRKILESGGRRALGQVLGQHLAQDFDRVLVPRAWRVVEALPRDAQGKLPARALHTLLEEGGERPTEPEILASRREPGLSILELRVPEDLAFLEGHFPGRPVVAGVVQLHWVMRVLEEELGVPARLASLEAIKFHDVLGPGDQLRLRVEAEKEAGRFRFVLVDAQRPERIFSQGRGRLGRPDS
jgi:acyl-coenzyme A synthetase/AMP-(fatty) acid ligase